MWCKNLNLFATDCILYIGCPRENWSDENWKEDREEKYRVSTCKCINPNKETKYGCGRGSFIRISRDIFECILCGTRKVIK